MLGRSIGPHLIQSNYIIFSANITLLCLIHWDETPTAERHYYINIQDLFELYAAVNK